MGAAVLWLLAAHAAVGLLLGPHLRWWVRADVKRFADNGSRDSLGSTFHRQRLSWRVAALGLLALAGSLPLWGCPLAYGCSVAALLVLAGAHWFRFFNPALNVARQLAYVGKWHVSWSPNAARFPDRYVWGKAWQQVRRPDEPLTPPAREDVRAVAVAGPLLRHYLLAVWLVGLGAYALLMGLSILFRYS